MLQAGERSDSGNLEPLYGASQRAEVGVGAASPNRDESVVTVLMITGMVPDKLIRKMQLQKL
jgi:hypothetical protein